MFLTLLLIGVLCACFCGIAFAYYVHSYINPTVQEDITQLSQNTGLDLNSFIYSVDPNTGEEKLYETLKGLENRVPVTIDKVPQELKDAVIAVEDKRFYEHKGVDWKGTLAAVKSWVFGGAQRGGSTITQQLIKNVTKDDDYSVKRKVTEIFRALALEKAIGDKDQILERYLNTIYLGYNCYGVKTASERYFGKDVSQLDLSECAVLAGLTNNPSIYDPYNHPDKVKERQTEILDKMLEQGLIDQSAHDAAVAKEIVYRPYEDYVSEQNDLYTYFTDAIIKDLINDLMEQKGYSELMAKDMIFSGGLKIYATIDTRIQQIMDEEYANDANFPDMTRGEENSRPQSAMVVTDKQGNIKGIVGGRGQKTESRGFSRATDARRQPGSSFKPLATYGPAMDTGVIVPTSSVYDKALKEIDGQPWPRNDSGRITGAPMVIKNAIAHSVNTVAVQVMNMLTPQTSYDYLTQRLGFKAGDDGLVASKANPDGTVTTDIDLAPLALGGLTNGVTVREMAGGFSSFINEGVFAGTRTYSKVLDSEGNVLLENTPRDDLGFKNVRTAYYMLECMQGVTSFGTASNVGIPGVQTAGKTGTTSANYDRWFCGVTPTYSAAVWFGFDQKYTLTGLYGNNPASVMWNKVMNRVHEGDSGLVFDSHPGDFVNAQYCMDSGLKPSGACRAAGRVATGRFWKGQEPTELCSHQGFKVYDLGKNTGIDFKNTDDEDDKKDDENKDDPNKPDTTTPTDPSVDPETGRPVTPPSDPNQGGTTDPGGTT
ncbi:MAG: transglycosylase domain-containing protein, partial [Eubacteriales bacterium]|nr:transglycosylase domain-containing protein [Eubacteriales bacterium]